MDNKLRSQLKRIGFKASESSGLRFEFLGIYFDASQHHTNGLSLVISYYGKDSVVQFEEYLLSPTTTKDIANSILSIYKRILPEEAAVQEENFRRKYGSLRP
jgi:hypothetical protein